MNKQTTARIYYWTCVNHANLTSHYHTDRLVYWTWERMLQKTKQELYHGRKSYNMTTYIIQSRTSSAFQWRNETRGSWPDAIIDSWDNLPQATQRLKNLLKRYGGEYRLIERRDGQADVIVYGGSSFNCDRCGELELVELTYEIPFNRTLDPYITVCEKCHNEMA